MSFTVTITKSSSYVPHRTEVWTNFGPLTTAFTPPAHCQTDPAKEGLVEYLITSGSMTTTSYDCGQANAHYIQQPECYPSSSGVSVVQTGTTLVGGYWSPGLLCPSGWSTAYSWTYANDRIQSSMVGDYNAPFTFAKCCPSGFKDVDGYCVREVTTSTFGAMCDLDFHCTQNNTSASYICPTSPVAFTWSPAQTNTQISITGYAILLVHQPSDMSLVQTSSPTTVTVTKSSSTTRTGGATTRTHHHQDHGTPTKVLVPAIVVPVVALFAIIAAIIFFLRARKRRARASAYSGSAHNPRFDQEKDTVRASVVSTMGDRAEVSQRGGVH